MGKIKSINWVIQSDLKLGIRTKKKPKLGNTGHSSVQPPLAYKDAHLCCRVKCMVLVNVVMCLFPILNSFGHMVLYCVAIDQVFTAHKSGYLFMYNSLFSKKY